MIIGIDPGTTETAWVILLDGRPVAHAKEPNAEVLSRLRDQWTPEWTVVIEMIASYGMAVGKEVFETCVLIGRMVEAWEARGGVPWLVYRRDVKLFHCETSRANDANIRAALLDRYGPGRAIAVGTKSNPGPCYGIKSDCWSALAVALTAENKPLPAALFREPQQQKELSPQPF